MQSDPFSEPVVFDSFLLDENPRESDVWADVHGEDMEDGGVDLFGNMDDVVGEAGENMDYMSSEGAVEHFKPSSPANLELSSPGNFELSSPENFELSSPEHLEASASELLEASTSELLEASTSEHLEDSSPEYMMQASSSENSQASPPKQVTTYSYASTLMSTKNYKGVVSTAVTKKSTIAKNFVVSRKPNTSIEATGLPTQRMSIDCMKQLKHLDIKYNTSGEIIQMYKGGVGKIYRIYDPDELYFDKKTGDTRTLTASELIASSEEFKRVEKNRMDARNNRASYNIKTAALHARIQELEDIRKKYQDLTGLSM